MKKLLREDGPILIISLLITYAAFRIAIGWGWNFIGAGFFAVGVGLIMAVAIQALILLVASRRGATSGAAANNDSAPTHAAVDHAAGDANAADRQSRAQDGRPGPGNGGELLSENETGDPDEDDGTASGTGAEESGPQGPVRRKEEYRSSLEDPD